MKKRLHDRKRLLQYALSLCLILVSTFASWGQQTIGAYPVMDGGFEAQTVGTLPATITGTVFSTWTYGTSGSTDISNTSSGTTGPRTGSKYAVVTVNSTSAGRQLLSPMSATVPSGSHVVQYYTRNAVNMRDIPVGIGPTGTNYAGDGKNTTATWAKVTQVVTPSSTTEATSYTAFRARLNTGFTTGGFDVDDVVIYAGSSADSSPPVSASGGAVNGLDVSWTASSNVDGGGYMVVRYASNPNTDQDPNQNGIYAKGLAITNGTNGVTNPGKVVYIGTATSFTDDVAGSSSGNDYYKVYAVDKAFNYATEIIATAVVSSTPTITSSIETLTGFNYTGAGPSTSQSFVVSGANLTNNLVVSTASTDYELSADNFASAGASSISLSGTTVASTTISVRLKASLAGGLKTATVSIASTGANTLPTVSLSGSVQTVYYYNGSGLLSSNTSWGVNTDGSGTNPTAVTDGYANFYLVNGSATTDASWTLGSNSKVIVGNGSAVTLTVADMFPITGTIDAAALGVVVWQHLSSSPTFGTLANDSEVHFQPAANAVYGLGNSTAYGKLFIDGAGKVSVLAGVTISTATVKNALIVASGSTLDFPVTNTHSITINGGASATINGTVRAGKQGGLFGSTIDTTPATTTTVSILFVGTPTLTLGASSTVDYFRPNAAQTVSALPSGVNYSNLTLSETGATADTTKTISGQITVNGILTINLDGANFSSTTVGADNITLGNGATIVRTDGTLNAAPFFGSTVNVIYNGTTAISSGFEIPINTTKLNNMTINNGAGVTLTSLTSLNGTLDLSAGLLTTGNYLTLKSNANGTAQVAAIGSGGSITGNVTVERYIPAKRAWRALTAPVSTTGSIFANWQEGGTGNGVNGFDIWMPGGSNGLAAGGSSNSLLEYNSADNAWTGITATNGSGSMMNSTKNKPFMAFVTGPYGSGNITSNSAATTLRATGSLITGTQTYATTGTQYTLIGNPYASSLSLTAMLSDTDNSTNFNNGIWIWDSNGNATVGSYNYFDKNASAYSYTNSTTPASNPISASAEIQSGQAFFVQSSSGNGASFSIKEAHKGTSVINTVLRDAAPAQLLRVGLYKQENNEWSGRDGAMTVILPDANANQSPNKMANGTENVAFVKNGSLFASNHHLPLAASDILNIRVWRTTAGANYKLKINTEQFASTNLNATLEDLFTNSRTPLNLEGTAVEYPFTVTNDALSTGDRFRIVFQNAVLGTNNPTATSFSIVPNPVTGDSFQVNLGTLATGIYSYSICNAIGQEVEKGTLNNVTQNTNYEVKISNSATGIYIMKIKGNDNTVFTAKIIKK